MARALSDGPDDLRGGSPERPWEAPRSNDSGIRSVTRRRARLTGIVAVALPYVAWGCAEQPDKAVADSVEKAVAKYGDPESTQQEAKEAIRSLGDKAVPYLRRAFPEKDPNGGASLEALVDIGSAASLGAILDACCTEGNEDRRTAIRYVRVFTGRHPWAEEQIRETQCLADAVIGVLASDEPTATALVLVKELRIREAVPALRRLLKSEKPLYRRMAALALEAIDNEDTRNGERELR